ncbi:MAG: hypothetical protein K6G73_12355 [Marinilabiliaceae bacterium]|nr:hypothetical protein [Marinilabiliaceae bacterium]
MSKILDLSVKEPFFDSIVRGAKKIEYREMSEYWIKKLVDTDKYKTKDIEQLRMAIYSDIEPKFIHYDNIRFHCGERQITCKLKDIRTYPHHRCFAIHIGTVL